MGPTHGFIQLPGAKNYLWRNLCGMFEWNLKYQPLLA